MRTPFDKIYVISLITNKSRQEFITEQMNELGIDFEFVYGIDFINLRKDSMGDEIPLPYLFGRLFKFLDINQTNAGYYGCTMTHYRAVLQAYEFGYKNVLIIEDDICMLKDKETIEKYLNAIPEDADYVTWDPRYMYWGPDNSGYDFFPYNLKNCKSEYMNLGDNNWMCGTMMYALMNRDIMKKYLDNQREGLYMCDHIQGIFRKPEVNRYTCVKCLGIDQLNYQRNLPKTSKHYNQCYINNYGRTYPELTPSMFFKPKEYLLTNLNLVHLDEF